MSHFYEKSFYCIEAIKRRSCVSIIAVDLFILRLLPIRNFATNARSPHIVAHTQKTAQMERSEFTDDFTRLLVMALGACRAVFPLVAHDFQVKLQSIKMAQSYRIFSNMWTELLRIQQDLKCFTLECEWMDLLSIEHNTAAPPKHQIQNDIDFTAIKYPTDFKCVGSDSDSRHGIKNRESQTTLRGYVLVANRFRTK